MARRCPKCGNPRLISRSRHYSTPYYECTVCRREWEENQIFWDGDKPFSHMLWDFVNQNPETLEYKGR